MTTISLPQQPPSTSLGEVHTSDLTAACLRRVYLKRQGHYDREITTACHRGNLANYALAYLHDNDAWSGDKIDTALEHAVCHVSCMLEAEGNVLSEAVRRNEQDILKQVRRVVEAYVRRLGPLFQRCQHIGCELPVSDTIEVDGETVQFASHVDLMFRDSEGMFGEAGRYHVWDWKYRQDAPSFAYLARNKQLALYARTVSGLGLCQGPVGPHRTVADRGMVPSGISQSVRPQDHNEAAGWN